jgi:hypothetical protein
MIIELIRSLSKEEVRHIKIFLNRTNSSDDRKDIQLFDLFRNSRRINEERFFHKLYPEGEKNAYYRLKNRLTDEVLKGLGTLYYNDGSSVQALQVLAIARHFASGGDLALCQSLLSRAESLALKEQDHGLLEIILTELLRMAIAHPSEEHTPEEIIARRLLNREFIGMEQEVDDILSVISNRMRATENEEVRAGLLQSLREELDALLFGPRLKDMEVLRIRLFHAYHQLLHLYSSPRQIEKFLRQTYKAFRKEKLFTRFRRALQAGMLRELIRLTIEHGKHEKALEFLDDLQDLARTATGDERRELLSAFYSLSHQCFLGINPYKASDLINEALSEKALRHDFGIRLRFNAPLLKAAHVGGKTEELRTRLAELRNERGFIDLDPETRIKAETADLLIRWAAGDQDYVKHFLNETRHMAQGSASLIKQAYLLDMLQRMCDGQSATFDMDRWKELSMRPDFETGDMLDYDRWLLEVR